MRPTLISTLHSCAMFLLTHNSLPRVSSRLLGILLHKDTEAIRLPTHLFFHVIYKIYHS